MKRRVVCGGCVLIAALAVALASASSALASTVTLKMAWQTGAQASVNPLVAAFEKANPSIKVDVSYLPIDTYGQAVQTEFQGGNGPDLVWGSPGTGNSNGIGVLYKQGRLANLATLPFAHLVPKNTGLWDGGVLYGIPIGAFPVGLMVNVNAMKAANATVPTTFSQLLTECKATAKEGKAFISLPGQGTGGTGLFGAALASQWVYASDPNWTAQRDAGTVSFSTSKLWKTVFARFESMKTAGCYPAGAAGLSISQSLPLIASGQNIAALLPGDAYADVAGSIKGVSFAFYPFPGDTAASTRVPISFGQGLGINNKSQHLAQAEKLVEFLEQPTRQAQLANTLGVPSIAQFEAGKLTPAESGLSTDVKKKHTVPYAALGWPNPQVLTVLAQDLTGLLTGQTSVSQALKNLDTAWGKGSKK
jgi:raffinose/stachyose/melibiose transport system substrate-binding protein